MTAADAPRHRRVPIVGGNWKMHTTRDEARALLAELRAELDGLAGVEVVILPPTPWLADAHDLLAGSTLRIGAQHAYWERAGAYTGEVSPHQLIGVADYVLVGHSERRQLFDERDEETASKLAAVLSAGLRPLLAVGETGRERRAGETEGVLERQLHAAFEDAPRLEQAVVVAYEPVWAIGTGETATPEQAEEACAAVRGILAARFDARSAERCR
ncbi:MAG: triose-phosphate isomerase, partial [Chloroflexi bacterium]|nr:triose-phosphate isomerase [Chloroflexota bacterium]